MHVVFEVLMTLGDITYFANENKNELNCPQLWFLGFFEVKKKLSGE